jgi:hypothetical protein
VLCVSKVVLKVSDDLPSPVFSFPCVIPHSTYEETPGSVLHQFSLILGSWFMTLAFTLL